MSFGRIVHLSLTYLIGTIGILLLLYWLIIITYRLYLILNKHKQYLNSPELDPRTHSQILYTFTTVRNRDTCLVALILLETLIVVTSSFALPAFWSHLLDFKSPIVKETFSNCESLNSIIVYLYIYPAYALLFVLISISFLTQLLLISFLNSYLAGRYFGHSFPKIVVCKYIFVWIFQTFLQTICIIPKLQILFLPTTTLLLFLNWLNLIASSRKLSRAIRSKIKEIRLFEWNPTQFRNHSRNLKQYTISMGFLISAFFFLTVAIGVLTISMLLFSTCFIRIVYGININFDSTHVSEIHRVVSTFDYWVVYFFLVIYTVLLFLPSLFIFLKHIANLLYDRCTGKGNMQKINNALIDPLINNA